jgi:uncharacterized membrane protein
MFDDSDEQGSLEKRPRFFSKKTKTADTLANSEAAALASNEDLDANGRKQEHGRHQKFRDHANLAAILVLWFVVALTLLGMFVFSVNLMLPECHQWLTPAAQEKIQTLLAAALLSSAMTGYVNRRMEP